MGALRFEAELRRGWSHNYGRMAVLGDVEPIRAGDLAVDHWEWSQMGVAVVGSADNLAGAVARLGLPG